MSKIFINYRTGDGHDAAALLDRELCDVFGADRVFRDRRSMAPGTRYPQEMRRHLAESTVLLALIGPKWLDLREDGPDGRRLIDVPGDWVHEELRSSLGVRTVIPVLLGGLFAVPDRKNLPKHLRDLTLTQPHTLRPHHAHLDVKPLVDRLREFVPAEQEQRPAPGASPTVASRNYTQEGGHHNQLTHNSGTTHHIVADQSAITTGPGTARVTNHNRVAPKRRKKKDT